MLVNDSEAIERLASPANLINRLAALAGKKNDSRKGLDIFKPQGHSNGSEGGSETNEQSHGDEGAVTIDKLIDHSDSQIKLATAHNAALDVMNLAINELSVQIPSVKPDKLPAIIIAASKVVSDIRKERSEAQKSRGNNAVSFHFYIPEQRTIDQYEVIEVNATPAR